MKTNLPEFSAWTESDNLVTGRTNNPWNLDRTPGGSSGGESAAIAAGLSPIGIGSDVMISVRGPAAFTGIAALKATHGRVPYTGHYPRSTSHWWHVGPMARTVGDVALGYSILQGPTARMAMPSTPATRSRRRQVPGPADPGRLGLRRRLRSRRSRDHRGGRRGGRARLPNSDAWSRKSACRSSATPSPRSSTLVYGEIVPPIKTLAAGRESQLHAVGAGIVGDV